MRKEIIISLIGLSLLGNASEFYYQNGKKVEVVKIEEHHAKKLKSDAEDITYYKTSTGHKIGVKNDLFVSCKKEVDCKELLKQYKTLSVNKLTDTIFLVKIDKERNIFEFTQKLLENSDIEIAQPNFRKQKKRR